MSSVRFDWYQNANLVIIDLFAKNLNSENVSIKFSETKVEVNIQSEQLQFNRTFHLCETVNVKECKFTIGKVKVEIQLAKNISVPWKSLEIQDQPVDASLPPKYPSSAKKPVDANSIGINEKEEEPTGEAAINALFQKIYANADEDTRRAMMKSFVESKGTVLNTNWSEVGSKNIEPIPPKNN